VAVKLNAKFVKHLLIEKDIDQRGLAELSGLSEITISRLMQGNAFNSDTLGRVATALRCHPVDLIEASGYDSPHVDAPVVATIRA